MESLRNTPTSQSQTQDLQLGSRPPAVITDVISETREMNIPPKH